MTTESMTPDSQENSEKVGIGVQRLVLCIGRHANDGCGYQGGISGETCPDCGGMLLSQKEINIADEAAREALVAEAMKTQRRVIDWRDQSDDGLRLRCG